MKEKLKRIGSFMLSLLILFNSLVGTSNIVFAEENDIDYSEATEEIIELGYAEDVFNEQSRLAAQIGERYAYIPNFDNAQGFSYITHLYVDGKTVFCIEPGVAFTSKGDYNETPTYWNNLSEQQKQAIWEISYYGYDYPGHQNSRYYCATQLMIWEVVSRWYDPFTPDGSSYLDVSAEINDINALRSQPGGRPSFANQTVKMGLNTPVTLTDTKGVLGNFNITGGNGINAWASGNTATFEITSENYANQLTFGKSNGNSVYECNIIYGGGGLQHVIYLAKRTDPTPNFRLNFELLYGDIKLTKEDIETGSIPQGDATLEGGVFEVINKDGNVVDTLTTNNEGKATSKKFPIGTTYTIKEKTPPTGYTLKEDTSTVHLLFEGDNTKEHFYTTEKNLVIKGKIEIAKSIEKEDGLKPGSNIEKPGQGFVFDIVHKRTGELVATLTTNEDGRAISELLPYGVYTVTERPVEGMDHLEPFEVFIQKDQKIYFYNIFNDTFKAELTIYKIDSETLKRIPAAGVEFKIKDADGNFIEQTVTYPTKYTTTVFKTDENGSVHLPELLRYGKYSIVEIKAPYGYVLKGQEIPLNIDGTDIEIFMNFDNTSQKGQVYVEKYGEFFTGAETKETDYGTLYTPTYTEGYLDGVTYQITAKEDIIGQEGTVFFNKGDIVDTFTTTNESITTSALLQLGAYSIKEISTKDGYVLDETIYDFDIEYAGQLIDVVKIEQSYKNERQKLDLKLIKTFEDNDKNAYKDVVFGVYSRNDLKNEEETIIPQDSLVGILTLKADGTNNEQLDLPFGSYYLKELKTSKGFILDSLDYGFTFTYGDSTLSTITIEKTFENQKRRVDIEVTKADSKNHNHLLNGAIFEVWDTTINKKVSTLSTGQLMIVGDNTGL